MVKIDGEKWHRIPFSQRLFWSIFAMFLGFTACFLLFQYQREREVENRKYAEEIHSQYAAETGREIKPSDDEVLKYRLWEEQQHVCPYTGRQIRISDFVGSAPDFDIEHTLPQARGGDDSQMNKTLCENRFNRETKRAKLPAELSNHVEIMERIESFGWREKMESLQKQIEAQVRRSKSAAIKSEKDDAIQRRHYLQMQLDYWRGKYERFTMAEIPEGFSNRQGVDIGIIGKYARLYLKTVFDRIYTVKGSTTAAFRKMWGLQEEYARKERTNHVHHCIDAITIACIGRREYDRWAQYVADEERYGYGESGKPRFEKPWPTFTEDVKAAADELLVAHHTPDNMTKQTRRKLRVRGRIKLNADGEPIYQQGDTARCRLHQDTFYGAIKQDGEIRYVIRKSLAQLQPTDIDKIIDDAVRDRVREAIDEVGFKTAMNPDEYTIWMNREKGIPIRKVRIFTPSVKHPIALKKQRDLSAKECHLINMCVKDFGSKVLCQDRLCRHRGNRLDLLLLQSFRRYSSLGKPTFMGCFPGCRFLRLRNRTRFLCWWKYGWYGYHCRHCQQVSRHFLR